jgi:hypothetical protein
MATALTTNFNYTYPGLLSTDIAFKPSEDTPALSDIFTIDPGIKDKKQYNLLNQLNKILKPYTGCERTFSGAQVITNKTLQTKEFDLNLEWCKDDFTEQLAGKYNHLAQEWLRTGIDSFNPEGTPINSIISQLIEDAVRRDVFRRVSFGESGNSSADWNQIDGLWTLMIDSSGGSNYCVRRAGSALGTGSLTADNAIAALQAVWDESHNLLKAVSVSQKKFYVTGSVYDGYLKKLQGTGAVTEQAFTNIQTGKSSLTFNGVDVVPVRIWDTELEDSANPLFGTAKHLVILTTKPNHILGIESGADLNKVEGWYERKDRKYYFEGNMKMGYQYLHCDLQTIAY